MNTLTAREILARKLNISPFIPSTPPLPPKRQFIKIKFINQGLGLLIISNIFRYHRVIINLSEYFENHYPLIYNPYKITYSQYHFQLQPSSELNSIFVHLCGLGISVSTCSTCCHMYITCIPDKGMVTFYERVYKYRFPSKIEFTPQTILSSSLGTMKWKKNIKKKQIYLPYPLLVQIP